MLLWTHCCHIICWGSVLVLGAMHVSISAVGILPRWLEQQGTTHTGVEYICWSASVHCLMLPDVRMCVRAWLRMCVRAAVDPFVSCWFAAASLVCRR